jgi:segregation and condensation protein A
VADEANRVVAQLRQKGSLTFRSLVSDADNTLVVIARFLALLELYKEGLIRFEQIVALGELHVTWTGAAEGEVHVSDEFDRPIMSIDDVDEIDREIEPGTDANSDLEGNI